MTKCPDCGEAMIGVEYRGTSQDYDGVSEWNCEVCGTRIGRWSGRRLTGDTIEGRYGRVPALRGDSRHE